MSPDNLKLINQYKKGSFLWEVQGGNAKMYLNGTVHMLPKSFFPLKNENLNRFDECRNLVLEVILDENKIEGIRITNDIIYNKDYIYEDGDSLYNHYPKEKNINLKNYLVKNKLCSEEISNKFYKLKPEVVENLIYDGIFKQAGIDQEQIGIDYYLMKRAHGMGKNILELETIEFQMSILAKLDKTGDYKKAKEDDNKSLGNTEIRIEQRKLSILDTGWFSKFIRLKMNAWILSIRAQAAGKLYGNEEKIKRFRKK